MQRDCTLQPLRDVLVFAAWVAMLLNVLKGARKPGLWAATHLQFDWSQGFLKRSLLGTLLKALGLPIETYAVAASVAIVLTAAAFLGVAAFVWRSKFHKTLEGAALCALMGTSFAVALMSHLVGYFDHALVLLTLASLGLILRARGAVQEVVAGLLSALFVVAGLLTHEVFLVFGVPVICTAWALRGRWVVGALTGAGALVLTALLMEHGVAEHALTVKLIRHHEGLTDFNVRRRAFMIFERDSAENIRVTQDQFRSPHRLRSFIGSLFTLLPLSGLFSYLSARRVWAERQRHTLHRALAVSATLGVGAVPHGLVWFGWDIYRWHAQSVVSAFLMLIVVSLCCAPRAWSARERLILPKMMVAMALFNAMAGYGFFDGYKAEPAPYLDHIKHVERALSSDVPLLKPPKR